MKSVYHNVILVSILGLGVSQASHIIGYQFESSTGTSVTNTESATLYGGTLSNGATVGSPNTSQISPGSNSLLLNGTKYMAINDGGNLLNAASGFSFTSFFQLAALPATAGAAMDLAFFSGTGAENGRASVAILGNGSVRVGGRRDTADGFASYTTAAGLIGTGQSYGVGATVDFSSGSPLVKIFINGMLVANTQGTTGFSNGTAFSAINGFDGVIGGRSTGTEVVNGRIDDVKIWNTAIPDSAAMANSVPEPGSVLLSGVAGLMLLSLRRRKA